MLFERGFRVLRLVGLGYSGGRGGSELGKFHVGRFVWEIGELMGWKDFAEFLALFGELLSYYAIFTVGL